MLSVQTLHTSRNVNSLKTKRTEERYKKEKKKQRKTNIGNFLFTKQSFSHNHIEITLSNDGEIST